MNGAIPSLSVLTHQIAILACSKNMTHSPGCLQINRLSTPAGFDLVEDHLDRIEYGVYA